MASGICYTQSGNVKKYEGIYTGDVPDKVTVYTVGYPSTTYYLDGGLVSFSVIPYPPPPGYPEVEGFVEGTAHYITGMYLDNSTYNKIYNLMSDTPPDGYVLDENGDYIVTTIATVYSYNYGIKYYDKTNTVNGGTQTIKREFRYKKADKPNIYKYYDVVFDLFNSRVYCSCNAITEIPGTDNGNFTLGVEITIGNGNNHDTFKFSWVMKTGINDYKYLPNNYNKYGGSCFTTRNNWERDNGDGTKTFYIFRIDTSSIPKA